MNLQPAGLFLPRCHCHTLHKARSCLPTCGAPRRGCLFHLPTITHSPTRGFGTVRFTTREEAEAAIEKMNNSDFEGRTITVRLDRYA